MLEIPRPRHRPDIHGLALAAQGDDLVDQGAGADGGTFTKVTLNQRREQTAAIRMKIRRQIREVSPIVEKPADLFRFNVLAIEHEFKQIQRWHDVGFKLVCQISHILVIRHQGQIKF